MLYYKATRWLWGEGFCGGLGGRKRTAPASFILGRAAVWPRSRCRPPAPRSCAGCATRCTLTGPILIPCSVFPPPRSSFSTYLSSLAPGALHAAAPRCSLHPTRVGVSSVGARE